MIPAAAPPSPQEVHHKLSLYPVSKGAISAMKPFSATSASASTRSPVSGAGTESDPASDSVFPQDVFSASAAPLMASSSSLPPLSSIAERHSGSGEDSEDEDEDTLDIQGAKTAARGSVGENVIKSGYLWKKGERRKTWKKRWFVLRPAHLAYYKTSAEYELLRLLDLADVHSCTRVTLKKHENTFGLVSPVRTFYLQAESQSEVQEWIKALEDARQALMATSTQNSTSGSISIPTPRARPDSLSFTPSPPHHHHQSHAHNVTSSDSDDPSPHVLSVLPSSSQAQAVSSSPSKSHFPGASDPAKIVLSGYLMKCGSKLRNWRKRWFILTGEHLMYTGSHMDTKPHRKFEFSEIIDALEYDLPAHHRYNPALGTPTLPPAMPGSSASDDADDAQRKHTFKIITTKRTLLVCAPSEEEEIKWLGAVRALIARRSGTGTVPGESGGAGKSTA